MPAVLTLSMKPVTFPAPPPIEDVTRRDLLRGVGALGAGWILAGCARATDSVTGPSDAPSTSRIDTVLGPVDVPADPQRVIAIEGRDDLDYTLALGLPLVGYPENRAFGDDLVSPFLREALAAQENAEPLFARGELNFEVIAAAAPDLIVARVVEAESFAEQLGPIAPVLPVPFDQPWQEVSERFARGLGRLEEHQAQLDRYTAVLDAIRSEHAAMLDANVVALQVDLDGLYVDGSDTFKSRIVRDLGGSFAPIVEQAEAEEFGVLTLSAERIDEALDGADGFLLVINTPEEVEALDANPLWANHPLVRDERFVTTNFFANGGGPLTAIGVAEVIRSLYARLDA